MILNQKIVCCRNHDNGFMLFNPDDGTATCVNSTGRLIWDSLETGMTEPKILQMLQETFPNVPEERLAADLKGFLGMLTAKGYLTEYNGPAVPMDSRSADGARLPSNRAMYKNVSMLRVFVPGDELELEEVPYGSFRNGDIITFYPKGLGQPGVVHRVIGRTEGGYVTMGDNNPGPDAWLVTPDWIPRLVVARFRPSGKRSAVSRGARGMMEFRWHRVRRCFRHVLGKCGRKLIPFMFWRKTLAEHAVFGDEEHFLHNGRLVAIRSHGRVRFLSPWDRLCFQVPEGQFRG